MNAPVLRLRVLPAIPPINGREIELRVTDTHIQQRLAGDEWGNLIALSEIAGPVGDTPTFRLEGGFVQWKPTSAPDTAWTNIIPLADITGPQGLQGLQGIQGPPGEDSDMLAATYDPQAIGSDAFARSNHTGDILAAYFPDANDTVNLPAIRRRLRAMPDLGDYGINSSGVTDYTAADFTSAIAGVVADGHRSLLVPAGNYRWTQGLSLTYGVTLVGENKSNSVFKFYHTGTGLLATGASENGGGLKALSIVNDVNALATAYLQMVANVNGTAPDFFFVDDCNFTCFGSGTVQYGIIGDGNARNGTAPNALVGLRNIRVRDTDVFNATILNQSWRNTRGGMLYGVRAYQAGGTTTNVEFTGADAARQSQNIALSGCAMGSISINHASKIIGNDNDIAGNATITSNANYCRVGTVFGTVSNSSATTLVFT